MSRRNFILLIIVLAVLVVGVFGYLYYRNSGTTNGGTSGFGTNFLSQFNPFASKTPEPGTSTEAPGTDTNGDGTITSEELAAVKLKKISSVPVAGYTLFSKERLKAVPLPVPPPENADVNSASTTAPVAKKKTGKATAPLTEFAPAIRYVDRATGNIYQTFIDKIAEQKFSTTVIPKIYDSYFGSKAMSVVMRHLKSNNSTIETFFGSLPKEIIGEDHDSNEINGSFLADGIKDISVSPDGSKIFYLLNTADSAAGTIMNLADGKKNQIFSSAFTEWNSFWPTSKIITLTTRPSANVLGYMYMLDTGTKNFTKILGDINGLTTLMSPSGKLVLVSNNTLSLYVFHTDTKAYDQLGINTLPEKCVWTKASDALYCAVPNFTPDGAFPDDWYKGEVSFSDQIWKINLKDGNTTLIADPVLVAGGENVDAIKLALDDSESHLFFVNKKDSFLWMLDLR